MMNFVVVLLCFIGAYYLIIFLDSKFEESAKIKAIKLAYKSLNEYTILTINEIKNLDDVPFDFDEIEPSFSPGTNAGRSLQLRLSDAMAVP
jgi:hypothetical protein